jgi:hypothetical protein
MAHRAFFDDRAPPVIQAFRLSSSFRRKTISAKALCDLMARLCLANRFQDLFTIFSNPHVPGYIMALPQSHDAIWNDITTYYLFTQHLWHYCHEAGW